MKRQSRMGQAARHTDANTLTLKVYVWNQKLKSEHTINGKD